MPDDKKVEAAKKLKAKLDQQLAELSKKLEKTKKETNEALKKIEKAMS